MSEKVEKDDFAKHEGTKFKGYLNSEEATEMELVEVSELDQKDRMEGFSLVFHAPADAELVSGIVKMEHPELGSIDIGVSPFEQDENGTKYEAVFNRIVGEPDEPPPTAESVSSSD